MKLDLALGRELLPLEESDSVLEYFNFILSLPLHLPLLQHLNAFLDKVLSIFACSCCLGPTRIIPLLARVTLLLLLVRLLRSFIRLALMMVIASIHIFVCPQVLRQETLCLSMLIRLLHPELLLEDGRTVEPLANSGCDFERESSRVRSWSLLIARIVHHIFRLTVHAMIFLLVVVVAYNFKLRPKVRHLSLVMGAHFGKRCASEGMAGYLREWTLRTW